MDCFLGRMLMLARMMVARLERPMEGSGLRMASWLKPVLSSCMRHSRSSSALRLSMSTSSSPMSGWNCISSSSSRSSSEKSSWNFLVPPVVHRPFLVRNKNTQNLSSRNKTQLPTREKRSRHHQKQHKTKGDPKLEKNTRRQRPSKTKTTNQKDQTTNKQQNTKNKNLEKKRRCPRS